MNGILFFGVEGIERIGVEMLCHDEGVEGAAIAIIEYEWGLRMRLGHLWKRGVRKRFDGIEAVMRVSRFRIKTISVCGFGSTSTILLTEDRASVFGTATCESGLVHHPFRQLTKQSSNHRGVSKARPLTSHGDQ